MVKTAASGSARLVKVRLQAMLPDWVMMATPRVDRLDAMFIGPESGIRQDVDEAIAVRTHQAHAIGRLDQLVLQGDVAGFGKACGIDDSATAAEGAKFAHHFDGGFALHRHKGGINGFADLGYGTLGDNAAKLLALRVNGVDLSGEAKLLGAANGNLAFIATDKGDGRGKISCLSDMRRSVSRPAGAAGRG